MQKNEWVYRELLYRRLEKGETQFTQLMLARRLSISLSTVHHALKPLESMGALAKTPMGFRLIDPKKALLLWASKRHLTRDTLYQTRVDGGAAAIEKSMPSGVVYAAYSGYKFRFDDVPADYSEVYVYAGGDALTELKRRFPPRPGPSTLVVLAADPFLSKTTENGSCSTAQLFVDLWNIRSWYAKEFLQALEKRIDERLD